MLAYYFYTFSRYICRKDLTMGTLKNCDFVHSDVQVRMRDSSIRQTFMQENVEKFY